MALPRTALIIRCTPEEAERIRAAAKRERRTISAFVVNAITEWMRTQEPQKSEVRRDHPGELGKYE